MIREYIEAIRRDRIALFMLFGGVAVIVCLFGSICAYIWLDSSPTPQAVASPTPAGPTPTPIVYNFNGEGDNVVFFDAPKSGVALIGMGHAGERNFIIEIKEGSGAFVDLLANEVGDYQGEKSITLNQGQHIIDIKADGAWFVVVLPPQ